MCQNIKTRKQSLRYEMVRKKIKKCGRSRRERRGIGVRGKSFRVKMTEDQGRECESVLSFEGVNTG